MSLTYCLLASGSQGNCLWLKGGGVELLVDCGLSARRTGRRLAAIGQSLANVSAVLCTHLHGDHVAGAPMLTSKHGLEVYSTEGTQRGLPSGVAGERLRLLPYCGRTRLGGLTIQTANVNLAEKFALQPPGEYVMLSVADTGHGMDKATLSRLFEPFFTTKEKGKGTGLGLSTVYGIVKQSGGYIWAFSELGRGTTFKIYLPRVDQPEKPTVPVAADTVLPIGKYQVILLVDDNDLVRASISAILESRAFKVLQASDGKQALELFSGHSGPIDLLISDVIMPYIGGRELAEKLRSKYSQVKVIFLSGYYEETVTREAEAEGIAYLAKPVSMQVLLGKIVEML